MFETELIASGDDILFGELTTLGGASENLSLKHSWDASPLNFSDELTAFDIAAYFFDDSSCI